MVETVYLTAETYRAHAAAERVRRKDWKKNAKDYKARGKERDEGKYECRYEGKHDDCLFLRDGGCVLASMGVRPVVDNFEQNKLKLGGLGGGRRAGRGRGREQSTTSAFSSHKLNMGQIRPNRYAHRHEMRGSTSELSFQTRTDNDQPRGAHTLYPTPLSD